MPYIDPSVIEQVRRIDLLTYLQESEPDELVRVAANAYCTKTHDSLKISNGMFYWWSRGIGGRSALDYLVKVRGMGFLEAVGHLLDRGIAPAPALRPAQKEAPKAPFALPQADAGIAEVERYLAGRGISRGLIHWCNEMRMLYQSRNGRHVNAVFVGYDKGGVARYASLRGTRGGFTGDVGGSDKRYSFALANGSSSLHLFESAIDLLSFATLQGIQEPNPFDGDLLSLSGVSRPRKDIAGSALPPALAQYLADHPGIRRISLHLDNDPAGRLATEAVMAALPKRFDAADEPPPTGKDMNDYLCGRSGLPRAQGRGKDAAR